MESCSQIRATLKGMTMVEQCDVAIIGAAFAGLTAGVYAARSGLKMVILERLMVGGQVLNVEKLETLPGFPQGISGAEMGPSIQKQVSEAGADLRLAEVVELKSAAPYWVVSTGDEVLKAKAVIVATGSTLRKLGVPGEETFEGRGVSECASCDGGFFMDQVVAVVGGGDSALNEALVLTDYASKVLLCHRGPRFSAQQAIQRHVLDHPKIEVRWNTVIEEIIGPDEATGIRTKDSVTGKTNEEALSEVFIFVGLEPDT